MSVSSSASSDSKAKVEGESSASKEARFPRRCLFSQPKLLSIMGKLNIAHHKSYHPYRRDNIERVRKDEEEAKLKEEREEGRMLLADSEARLDQLRERAGLSKSTSSVSKKRAARLEDEANLKRIADGTPGLVSSSPSASTSEIVSTLTTPTGHINLFVSLEASLSSNQLQALDKKAQDLAAKKESERGEALAPSEHDLKPWYVDRDLKGGKERDLEKDGKAKDRKNLKEMKSKSASDPLKAMNAHLAKRAEVLATPSLTPTTFKVPSAPHQQPVPSSSSSSELTYASSRTVDLAEDPDLARNARLSRESSERGRLEALRARKKREAELLAQGSETPSTTLDTPRSTYGDVYNVREVREAREARRWGTRRWDDEEDDAGERSRERESSGYGRRRSDSRDEGRSRNGSRSDRGSSRRHSDYGESRRGSNKEAYRDRGHDRDRGRDRHQDHSRR